MRVRVSKSDLDKLHLHNEISSTITFPNRALKFKICTSHDSESIKLIESRNETKILLTLPSERILNLYQTDNIGFSRSFQIADEQSLDILFEKDFKCLAPRDEDESDLFNHPNENQLNC